ncbi:MAG TPA: glycosyltransferase family 4 protein [Thermoanaerobaculia bacterium]|nr:glycosyltransferase family 4 protein [Thermoanaerobaculia bacterium]
MRILHIGTDSFGGYGGIALYNRELIAAMASHPSVDEVVVIPRIIVGEREPLPEKVTFVSHAARGRLAFLRAVRHAGTAFDLVICAHVNLLPIARLVTKHPLLMLYGIEAWKTLRDPISNRLLRGLRGVVSISDVTLERFIGWSHYDGPSQLLPNSIRAEWYGMRPKSPALAARYHLEGKRVLMTLGRVVAAERYKGFDEVLEVLPHLDADVSYVIAGGGNDIPRLQRKAVKLGVPDRVIFTGLFPEEEKADLYNLADVYVMPSRGEGFGFVFLEALACGIPVIASRLDGGREAVLGGQLGQLVDPTNPAEIRLAILDALAAGEKQIPEGLAYFSYENFERRTHAIIDGMGVQGSWSE